MRPTYLSGGPPLAGSKAQIIVCFWVISMPIPAEMSQVRVPTFTFDWAMAGDAISAAAAVSHPTRPIVMFDPPGGAHALASANTVRRT